MKVRPAPAAGVPLPPLRNRESYEVPLDAGQSVVALAVGAADDCVAVEEGPIVECVGVVIDCAVELGGIVSFQTKLYHFKALPQS